jgi:hypothetical protein
VSFLRKLLAVGAAIFALAAATPAMAGSGVTLTAPKFVSVNYTACQDPTGNTLPCVTVDYTVSNGTSSAATCSIYVLQIGFTISLGAIAPRTAAGGGLTTPYTGFKRLTLSLTCNGSGVPSQTARVRVLAG